MLEFLFFVFFFFVGDFTYCTVRAGSRGDVLC